MSTLSEQLLSLALTPLWQPSVESDNAALLASLNTAEQALLREKIICFVYTPEPENPEEKEETEETGNPNPQTPTPSDDKENLSSIRLAG
ncbi:hypothetical protein AEST_06030 [Alishewanella aestuarii B11]|uniref:Uncharacterized protein n=1 Tax=Alishewanella aestuarii B11 TaxID=1197174 RepID=J2IGD8_9ALTE|nr:hypothetical protein [Alishewanella aestuarii]EJI86287.1 hypothetical protein AEST_06030 [Alishewanella aestuarii B11]